MRTYRRLAMGLLALLLCIALPSCSDDDDNAAQTEEEEQKGVLQLLNLQMNLCLVNLQGEPTEATFGVPVSETNTAERIYYTKDLATAKKRYQLLFHSDTKCSADGNTYTLANKLGTATFTEASGNKGELAVATFDVPGLKGLVKKVHFIDYTQRGENTTEDEFSKLNPGCLVLYWENNLYANPRNAVALAPLKGKEDTYVVITPYTQQNLDYYRPTGFTDKTMVEDDVEPFDLTDYLKSLSNKEYYKFSQRLIRFLFERVNEYSDDTDNHNFAYWVYPEVWGHEWDMQSYYFQVKSETVETNTYNDYSVFHRYHMLLHEYDTFLESPIQLWDLSTTVIAENGGVSTIETDLPEEFEYALPLWITVATVNKYNYLTIYD